jgi:hypothetical protein
MTILLYAVSDNTNTFSDTFQIILNFVKLILTVQVHVKIR